MLVLGKALDYNASPAMNKTLCCVCLPLANLSESCCTSVWRSMTIQPMTRVPPMANEMDAIFKMLKKVQGNEWDRADGDWDPLPTSRLCFLFKQWELLVCKEICVFYSKYLFVRIFLLTCTVGCGAKANCKSDADSLSLLAAFSSWIASLFITLLFISRVRRLNTPVHVSPNWRKKGSLHV